MRRHKHKPLPPDWMTCSPRFWSHVRIAGLDECWIWTASVQREGYGQFTLGSKPAGTRGPFRSHRVAWALANGADPGPSLVLHHCDNPPCQNQRHLFVGTHPDNIRDMVQKRRDHNSSKTHCPRNHPYSIDNTYVTATGSRRCKKCLADAQRERHGKPRLND